MIFKTDRGQTQFLVVCFFAAVLMVVLLLGLVLDYGPAIWGWLVGQYYDAFFWSTFGGLLVVALLGSLVMVAPETSAHQSVRFITLTICTIIYAPLFFLFVMLTFATNHEATAYQTSASIVAIFGSVAAALCFTIGY